MNEEYINRLEDVMKEFDFSFSDIVEKEGYQEALKRFNSAKRKMRLILKDKKTINNYAERWNIKENGL